MTNVNLNYTPRKWQQKCHANKSRFRVFALHRRAGKTVMATMELIDAALKCKLELGLFVYIAPYLSQAKAIAWGMIKFRLKDLIEMEIVHVNEAELTITFKGNGAKIKLYGADNPDSLRGVRLDGAVLDEVGQMKPMIWDEIIQPALSDRKGFAIFIGCVVPSTRILTASGMKRIGTLSQGKADKTLDKIDLDLYGIDKAWHNANGFFYNGKVETIKATTSKGFNIEASYPHPILVCDRSGEYFWKRMRDLEIGDKACIDYGMEIWGNKDPLQDFHFHNDDGRGYKARRHTISLPTKMDEDFAYLMGLWLAEGSIEHKTYRVTITCGDSDDVSAQIEKYGFRKCRKDQWRCNSHVLVEMMKHIGMPLVTAPNKFLPDWVWNGKREWAAAFVSGYLDGDGWVRSGKLGKNNNGIRRELGFASSSKQLLQDLQVLLTNAGAIGKLRSTLTKPTKRVKVSSNLNQLNYGGKDFDALKNFLKLRIKRKAILLDGAVRQRKIVDIREKYVLDEIVSLEGGFSETFDFTVPETNSFWTNGFISHNTPSGINLFSEKFFKAKSLDGWSSDLFTVYDTEAIDKEEVERLKRDMSTTSFAREFLCDFSAAGEDQLISMDEVETAAKKVLKVGSCDYAPKIIGVDPARFGDDASTIIRRQGFQCFDPISFHGMDNMELANQVIYHINDWEPDAVFIDAGNGSGVIDRIRQLGHEVIEVPFGGKSGDPKCSNKRSEMYCNLRDWLREGGAIPNHTRLKQDLATPRYWFDKFNRIILEPKDDIKSRGLPSPDYSDALCFVKNTMISTPNGEVAIQDIRHGDMVCTPFGNTVVKLLWKNETNVLATARFNNGNTLIGTPNHNIFVWGSGEKRLDALTLTDVVSVYGQRRLLWKFLKVLSTLGVNIQFKQMVDITRGLNVTELGFFIATCGLIISERYQKIMTFITRMIAGGIMNQKTLNQYVYTNIDVNMPRNLFDWGYSNDPQNKPYDKLLNGTDQKTEFLGTENTQRNSGKTLQQKQSNVKIAEMITKPIWGILNTALTPVCSMFTSKRISRTKESVRCAAGYLKQTDTETQNIVLGSVQTGCAESRKGFSNLRRAVRSVASYFSQRLSTKTTNVVPVDVRQENVHPTTVYNLTLEKHNAYYANGILVFNCLTFAHPVSVKNKSRIFGKPKGGFTGFYDPLDSDYIQRTTK